MPSPGCANDVAPLFMAALDLGRNEGCYDFQKFLSVLQQKEHYIQGWYLNWCVISRFIVHCLYEEFYSKYKLCLLYTSVFMKNKNWKVYNKIQKWNDSSGTPHYVYVEENTQRKSLKWTVIEDDQEGQVDKWKIHRAEKALWTDKWHKNGYNSCFKPLTPWDTMRKRKQKKVWLL